MQPDEEPFSARTFEPGDVAQLTELLHAAYAELGSMGLNYTAVDQDEQTTRERAAGGQCWIVEQNGQIVGSLTMSLPPSDALQTLTPVARDSGRAWLNQVAVSPALQGRGIATRLWRQRRRWAAAQGATSIGVDTAVPAEHLERLYRSWGFQRIETIHWPGKTYDSVVMTRQLSAEDD